MHDPEPRSIGVLLALSARMRIRWVLLVVVACVVLPGTSNANEETPLPIEKIDLEELLSTPAGGDRVGAFGYNLQASGIKPFIHGYTTFDWVKQQGSVNTFDAHYFNVFIGANIRDLVVPEIQLEHEHGNEIAVRYAQIDVRVAEQIYARAGLFLVPFGHYNEFIYPDYLTKLPRGPIVQSYRHVVPVAWNMGQPSFGF